MRMSTDDPRWRDHDASDNVLSDASFNGRLRTIRVNRNKYITCGDRRSGKTTSWLRDLNQQIHRSDSTEPIYIYSSIRFRNLQHIYRRLFNEELTGITVLNNIHQLRHCNIDSHIFIDDCDYHLQHFSDIDILGRFDNLNITISSSEYGEYGEYLMSVLRPPPRYQNNRYSRFDETLPYELYVNTMDYEPEEFNVYEYEVFTEEPEMSDEDNYIYRIGI